MAKSYQELKVVQPYVELLRGSAPPEYSITSNYALEGIFSVFWSSWSRRQWALTATSVAILWSSIISPFAGSLFTVKLSLISSTIPVISAGIIELNTEALGAPATFISAAGGADSMIFEEQPLPKFIIRDVGSSTSGWTVAPFKVTCLLQPCASKHSSKVPLAALP
ncbi:hypothetical protein DL93DRAFT_1142697 [Clavulina sp. PMI_390]|nr:hypothetical protein DL93DRAFT_1142697 [Clavulina sp. PMI_390]